VSEAPLLAAEGLSIRFGRIAAVEDASFALWPGEVLSLIHISEPTRH